MLRFASCESALYFYIYVVPSQEEAVILLVVKRCFGVSDRNDMIMS